MFFFMLWGIMGNGPVIVDHKDNRKTSFFFILVVYSHILLVHKFTALVNQHNKSGVLSKPVSNCLDFQTTHAEGLHHPS